MYNLFYSEVTLNQVMDLLKFLSENQYNVAWSLIDDFSINGHKVSIKNTPSFNHIVIDNAVTPIGGCIINGMQPLDYVRSILEKEK